MRGEKLRQHILDVATELFWTRGFRATGVDAIVARAGIAKRSLYNHFATKEELIAAVIQHREDEWHEWIEEELERRATDPRERILASFDALADSSRKRAWRGCIVMNAAIEFPRGASRIRRTITRNSRRTERLFGRLAREAGASDPPKLARELAALRRGAIMNVLLTGDPTLVDDAKDAAEAVLAAHLTAKPARAGPPREK